jgi:tRNA pseudouridine38-40 synthase
MRTVRLIIEYDGSSYSGWQVQPNGLAVQEVMEEALLKMLGEPVRLQSSGRTDAGVHAFAMVAAFKTEKTLPLKAFVDGLNNLLPSEIAVQDACEVAEDFKPIADALCKHYRYTIYNAAVRSPLRRLYTWHVREQLDFGRMQEAARYFIGRHDYAAFRASNSATKTSVRRIDAVDLSRDGNLIVIDVVGEGFLKNMVRVMAGTLVDIGRGRFEPEHIAWLLQNPDRQKAGVTAPASGLCLIKVTY